MCLLRYPGGKQRAVQRILSYIPAGLTKLYSPFFGGGSVELAWLSKNPTGRVIARDNFRELVNFWQQVLAKEGPAMADAARAFLPMSKNSFRILQDLLREPTEGSKFQRAVWFFVLNRSSFSGTTLSGGMGAADRFNESACARLESFKNFENLTIRRADAFDSIRRRVHRFDNQSFLFLDPPYLLGSLREKLYGNRGSMHHGFNHERLANILNTLSQRGVRWFLTYNDCHEVRMLYPGLRKVPATWKYGMSNNKSGTEVFIFSENFDHG